MIKKYALMLLILISGSGFLLGQMAMPDISIRQSPASQAVHVSADTWTNPNSAVSGESAEPTPISPENFTMQLSPNPTGDVARIELYLPQTARLNIALVSRDGKLIRNVYDANRVNRGHWSNNILLNGIPAGIYYLRMRVGEEFHSLPIVKI